ncbi:MAG: chromosome segregation protein SMC [Planctomycetota bacterium]|nr:MAG: chromosome segregation protein SMC [Planctomycetota bacterium]
MIQLESVHIEWARGIAQKLELDFQRKPFAISGPNGSGKSAVIDAVEFALTGQIGRLEGIGTKGLSVAEHGPHVDKAKFPDAAFVKLRVYIPALNKSATITRKFTSPKKPVFEPADDDIRAVLNEVADHPEITLSRRDIIRFILVEPSKRSAEIQTLLKLGEIGDTRSALKTAQNRLQDKFRTASTQVKANSDALRLHLQIETLAADQLLTAVNQRRKLLDLPVVSDLTAEAALDAGLSYAAKASDFNKESALRDLKALSDAAGGFASLCAPEAGQISAGLAKLEADPSLVAAMQRRSFIEKGLEFVEGPECPLCDIAWDDEESLRAHLQTKLAKSEEARQLQESLRKNGAAISDEVIRIAKLIAPVQKLAAAVDQSAFAEGLAEWKADLDKLKPVLDCFDGLAGLKDRLTVGWVREPGTLSASLESLAEVVKAKPDQSAAHAAQTFLTTAQTRLGDYRDAKRKEKAAKAAAAAAKAAYETYCTVFETSLNTLYEEVQDDFSNYYRELNGDDETKFTAKLTPSESKLDLAVNFYERGLFPPGAYHSEGHQDGMGVCLYLALMKRLFGDRFSLALLDDVVMSVDSDHRHEFCKLLKRHFPDTQFIITTHDRVWAEQMRSAGLVTSKTSVAFHSWTIETGPLVESNEGIWVEINQALAKGKVEVAAGALRRHLECVSRHLADLLGASPQFRTDGNYELGELLSSVMSRMKKLLGEAANAAQSWGDAQSRGAAASHKKAVSELKGVADVEQWVVNKAVHYNEWANLGKKDFEPVVAAFRDFLERFRCATCESWLYVTPKRGPSEALRCNCAEYNFNLKTKPK